MGRIFQPASVSGAERLAREWYESINPMSQVGTRHHIVPRTILRHFANPADQVRVRDRFTGKLRMMSLADLAVRDFYTFIDLTMKPNGSMEVWLSEVEAEFSRVIRPLLSPHAFGNARPFTETERFALDTFVAVQAVRGMRTRRAMELIADYGVKLVNQDKLDEASIRELEIFPHQNEHIQFIQRGSEKLADLLALRPVTIARFDSPLLIIGDEPVVLPPRANAPRGDLRKRLRVAGERMPAADLVQFSSGRDVGFADADEVILPLSPRHALLYGGVHAAPLPETTWRVDKNHQGQIAREMNRLQARHAFGWVAAHPEGPHLAQIPWPQPAPAAQIFDDRTLPADVVNSRPHARPHRFSR